MAPQSSHFVSADKEERAITKIVPPTKIPYGEIHIIVGDAFDIEANAGNRLNDLQMSLSWDTQAKTYLIQF